MRIITRGMGGGQDVGLILQGFTFESVIRGGRSLAKDIYKHLLEEFTIAAKLIAINGKESLRPIFNKRKYVIDESIQHKINIENIKIEKRISDKKINVNAKLIKINRGLNGKY